jgi:hypothetical protein
MCPSGAESVVLAPDVALTVPCVYQSRQTTLPRPGKMPYPKEMSNNDVNENDITYHQQFWHWESVLV